MSSRIFTPSESGSPSGASEFECDKTSKIYVGNFWFSAAYFVADAAGY